MNASFLGAPAGDGLGLRREARWKSNLSSISSSMNLLLGFCNWGGGETVVVMVVRSVLMVKTMARGSVRRRAQRRVRGVGDMGER